MGLSAKASALKDYHEHSKWTCLEPLLSCFSVALCISLQYSFMTSGFRTRGNYLELIGHCLVSTDGDLYSDFMKHGSIQLDKWLGWGTWDHWVMSIVFAYALDTLYILFDTVYINIHSNRVGWMIKLDRGAWYHWVMSIVFVYAITVLNWKFWTHYSLPLYKCPQ